MTRVFLSGSRRISRLNDMIRERVWRMMDQGFIILVGDANGADRALQSFLADHQYEKVEVFCTNGACRNNIGAWPVRNVAANPKLKGRAFYTVKDRQMAQEADYGFILWDGRSPGSINNACELVKGNKKAVIYYAPEKRFTNAASFDDITALLSKCAPDDLATIQNTIKGARRRAAPSAPLQGVLNL